MSYATILASVWGKRPVWLYEFTRDGTTTRLTSSPTDYLDANSITWAAAPLTHTRFRVTGSMERAQTMLVFPQSHALARDYLSDLSYSDNTVTIYHEYRDQSPQARVTKFRGRVIGAKPLLTRITLIAENRFTEARRKALPAVMQRLCRHTLYHESTDGRGCRVNIAYHQVAGTLSGLSGNVATVSAASGRDDGTYAGGVFTWSGKTQLITRHSGTSLTLLGPVLGMADALDAAGSAGLSVSIAPGCNLSRSWCNSEFGNIENHGGFPWISESPFDGKTLF